VSWDGGFIRSLAALCAALLLLAAAWQLAGSSGAGLHRVWDRAAAVAAERTAPLFARWLTASADAAVSGGVSPMPAEIRKALNGFVEPVLLERVRYRIGATGLTSMQALAFVHPHTRAIALDGVVVFRDQENAAKPRYWVHEIVHLEQIRRWGVQGFAARYIRDAAAVEAEAWAMTERYVAWSLRRELNTAAAPRPPGRGGG
jgi:hypothetical protein